LELIFDASALINLINGGALDAVLAIPKHQFFIGPVVYSECVDGGTSGMLLALKNDKLTRLDDSQISGGVFLNLLARHKLGDGETECLAFSIASGYGICSDDRKARQVAEASVGKEKIVGSLGLLREAVEFRLLTPASAYQKYLEMKAEGGFLPEISTQFFMI
jgi:predicted nucleic acid-binding protein